MPPKSRFTRTDIINAALAITRGEGINAATARAVGRRLDSSSKVIFGLFSSMDQLQNEVIKAAYREYETYISRAVSEGRYPAYKASGMAYIHFARDEKELFRLLFMRDRSYEDITSDAESVRESVEMIMRDTGLGREQAETIHMEMWTFVHGIAVMLVTSYTVLTNEMISMMLTDVYSGLKLRYAGGQTNDD